MSEPGDSQSCEMSSNIWVCWKRTAFECKTIESLLTERRAAVCMGGVLVSSVILDKLPLQDLPLWFQHWSSKLFDSVLEIGDCRLGPLGCCRTRCRSTKGFLELDLVHGLCLFYVSFLRKAQTQETVPKLGLSSWKGSVIRVLWQNCTPAQQCYSSNPLHRHAYTSVPVGQWSWCYLQQQ